ncbi:DNA repair helicase (plasmid) [Lactiplantibacillus plantarum]|nr:DNA repair helicase [Lactiplantibacillus plantarum]
MRIHFVRGNTTVTNFATGLNLKVSYNTDEDDVISDFYVPVLSNSVKYDRAAGYFSSSILVDYIAGLEEFVKRNGKMRLVISPFISESDGMAMLGALNNENVVGRSIDQMFIDYRADGDATITSGEILYRLIVEKLLEVRVIVPKNERGLFHEKFSIFYDTYDRKIVTNGSNNETHAAIKYNLESFMVMSSWKTGIEPLFCDEKIRSFDKLWNNSLNNYRTIDLQECVNEDVFKSYKTDQSIFSLYKKFHSQHDSKKNSQQNCLEQNGLGFVPRDYQENAANKWLAKQKGIISFATGTGKTKTAILCIHKYLARQKRSVFVLVVPDRTLVNQWAEELKTLKYSTIMCFSENPRWQIELKDEIQQWQAKFEDSFIVITTVVTFQKQRFRDQLKKLKDQYVFIADECHHLATNKNLELLPKVNWRLGLSATPEVYMSEDLTNRLQAYFHGIVATYSLEQAINNKLLVPYNYYPIEVQLNTKEMVAYKEISHKLVKMIGNSDDQDRSELSPAAQLLLFKRSRIIYGATEKIEKLDELIDKLGTLKHTLIYCGATSIDSNNLTTDKQNNDQGIAQLQIVNKLLHDKNINAAQYTESESGEGRKQRIDQFRRGNIGTLVAIKCLDEGVDIPEITVGIILASSNNPREFIQRRGRLLRRSTGKNMAAIYDMVVLSNDTGYSSINRNELKRIFEYGRAANNKAEIDQNYGEWFSRYDIGEVNFNE